MAVKRFYLYFREYFGIFITVLFIGGNILVKIGICEDNQEIMNYYMELINVNLKHKSINLETFTSGEEVLFKLENNYNHLDIIIMDIELGEINGLETTKVMRQNGFKGAIIYLTSIKDYVFDSFENKPLNYILKSKETDDKFIETLKYAIDKVEEAVDDFIIIGTKKWKKRILKKDIMYIESIIRVVKITVKNGEKYEIYKKLSEILEEINDKRFARVNKSYIINLEEIKAINQSSIIMNDEYEITIGRKYIKEVKEKFSDILNKKFFDN